VINDFSLDVSFSLLSNLSGGSFYPFIYIVQVHPKHPDFKRKDGSVSLWLSNCTTFVLSKLKGLEFEVPVVKSKKAKDSKGLCRYLHFYLCPVSRVCFGPST